MIPAEGHKAKRSSNTNEEETPGKIHKMNININNS